jgi:hypothetical protein
MPIGNGSLAANVWTEQNGDIVLLLSSPDAWTETGKLVKLGRIRVTATPNPFANSQGFHQSLHLEDGAIEIQSGPNTARIWIDANHPALHIEMHTERRTTLRAVLETWRKDSSIHDNPAESAGMFELGSAQFPVDFKADTVIPDEKDSITWYHFNQSSIYSTVMEQEHLQPLLAKYSDPLLHRCFGARITGHGLHVMSPMTLESNARTDPRLDIVALAEKSVTSPDDWVKRLNAISATANSANLQRAWAAHVQWWRRFWDRSWISVIGDDDARKVTQGYAMQRYMMAASSRGELPVKFNGGVFTVGHDVTGSTRNPNADHNPDYRSWGNSYWNQNNRLLYWPLVTTGDFDLLKPWFHMYLAALPLEKDRTELYYHHAGASFPETMLFWGVSDLNDFGWNNPSNEIQSRWQRYHIQGSLEVLAEMLDYVDATGDTQFAKSSMVPFADALITFYDQHYPRDADGKIRMEPAQSLETYQLTAVDPTPDIAGLRSVIPRLLSLRPGLVPALAQRNAWSRTLHDLPELPKGTTVANGKTPPNGEGDKNGAEIILPAKKYDSTRNSENPELYVAFPYRLYGVGKPDLKLAIDTFNARRFPQNTCWGQDGTESAVLGLTSVAQKAVIAEFTNYGDQRFPWFWKAAHDWIPDLDNGGSGMITLQEMLMQTDGKHIYLLPSWPSGWSADFKLHAPMSTIVEGRVENGKVVQMIVTPKSRARDVTVLESGRSTD